MTAENSIAFVVFFRDVGNDLQETLDCISFACNSFDNLTFELVIVDDGSKDECTYQVDKAIFSRVQAVRHPKSLGITSAIGTGVGLASSHWVLPIPGHAMFGATAIKNILKLCGQGDVIIGCRTNLAQSRPPLKRLASRILRDAYRHLTFYYIGDIHGLFLARKQDFDNFLSGARGHGGAILVITNVVASGGLLIQTAAPVQEGHNSRVSKRFRHNFPSIKAVMTAVSAILQARKIYKFNQVNV